MSFIELDSNYTNAKEPEVAPEGDYDLVIAKVDDPYQSSKGHTIIPVTLAIEGHDEYSAFRHWLVVPGMDTEDRIKQILNLNLKRFFYAFEVDVDGGFDPTDLMGARAECHVTVDTIEEDKDGNKLEQPFTTNKLRLPRLPRED